MQENRLALVTGATGGVGGEVAAALKRHGFRVRALVRQVPSGGPADGIEWVRGDAMNRADVMAAARGVAVVFHGVNPPGYRNWRGLAVPMLAHAIDAAQQAGARLAFPGTIYNYGPDSWPVLTEDSPQHPATRKGGIRVEMERMLDQAAAGGLRVLLVRAGDFFGPRARSSWVTAVLLGGGKPLRSVVTPERSGVDHAWAYLPDLAETFARLLDADDALPQCAKFHFAGHQLPGRGMAEAVRRAAASGLPVRPFRWLPVYLGAPFVTFLREVIEMRYLWREPLRLDNARLVAQLGAEPHTDLDAAMRATWQAVRGG